MAISGDEIYDDSNVDTNNIEQNVSNITANYKNTPGFLTQYELIALVAARYKTLHIVPIDPKILNKYSNVSEPETLCLHEILDPTIACFIQIKRCNHLFTLHKDLIITDDIRNLYVFSEEVDIKSHKYTE